MARRDAKADADYGAQISWDYGSAMDGAAAILVGNAIYYFSLVPHLPQALRHREFLLDWGSATDFAVCLAVYGVIRLGPKI